MRLFSTAAALLSPPAAKEEGGGGIAVTVGLPPGVVGMDFYFPFFVGGKAVMVRGIPIVEKVAPAFFRSDKYPSSPSRLFPAPFSRLDISTSTHLDFPGFFPFLFPGDVVIGAKTGGGGNIYFFFTFFSGEKWGDGRKKRLLRCLRSKSRRSPEGRKNQFLWVWGLGDVFFHSPPCEKCTSHVLP